MNETKSRRYSYNSNMPKQYTPHQHQSFQIKSQSPSLKPQAINNFSDELRKSYELIQNLKAQVELEKQGKQFLEQQNKYLTKKVQSYKQTLQQLQVQIQKYKDKYRKLKGRKKNQQIEPFEKTKHLNRQTELFLKQQQSLKQQLKVLESKINNTPSKQSTPKINYQKLISENHNFRKINNELQKKFFILSSNLQEKETQLKQKQFKLEELMKQLNIYHQSNIETDQGITLLQRQMSILVEQNRQLKQILVRNEDLHVRQLKNCKQQIRNANLISAHMQNTSKQKNRVIYNTDIVKESFNYSLHQRSAGTASDSRGRFNSTKKVRY